MKKKHFFIALMGILALAFLTTACSGQSVASRNIVQQVKKTKKITWGVKSDLRLVGILSIKDNQLEGFEVDLAKKLSTEIFGKDVQVNFVPVTSNTRMALLKNGNIDALVATMTITPDRQKVVDFSQPYFKAGQTIMVKRDSKIKSVTDLKQGTKVIGLQGSNSVQNIKKVAPFTKILQLPDAAQAFSALQSGQADAMTSDNVMLYGLLSDNQNYRLAGKNFTVEDYGIAVNKGQRPLLKKINRALAEMKADGTYNQLLLKWFGQIPGFKVGDVQWSRFFKLTWTTSSQALEWLFSLVF